MENVESRAQQMHNQASTLVETKFSCHTSSLVSGQAYPGARVP